MHSLQEMIWMFRETVPRVCGDGAPALSGGRRWGSWETEGSSWDDSGRCDPGAFLLLVLAAVELGDAAVDRCVSLAW